MITLAALRSCSSRFQSSSFFRFLGIYTDPCVIVLYISPLGEKKKPSINIPSNSIAKSAKPYKSNSNTHKSTEKRKKHRDGRLSEAAPQRNRPTEEEIIFVLILFLPQRRILCGRRRRHHEIPRRAASPMGPLRSRDKRPTVQGEALARHLRHRRRSRLRLRLRCTSHAWAQGSN